MTETTASTDRIEQFVQRLEQLDVGGRARLRRCAGKRLEEATDVLGLFYRLAPPFEPGRERQEAYFLIATLFPLAESDRGRHRNLGATLRAARNEGNAAGLDRRMEVLLDADREQLPFRLRQVVRLAQSHRVGINWPQLLRDVIQWSHPDRFVQRQWAEAYFAERPAAGSAAGPGRAALPR